MAYILQNSKQKASDLLRTGALCILTPIFLPQTSPGALTVPHCRCLGTKEYRSSAGLIAGSDGKARSVGWTNGALEIFECLLHT